MQSTKNLVTHNDLSPALDVETTPVYEVGATTKRNFSVIHNRLMKSEHTTGDPEKTMEHYDYLENPHVLGPENEQLHVDSNALRREMYEQPPYCVNTGRTGGASADYGAPPLSLRQGNMVNDCLPPRPELVQLTKIL